ncbi:MAG TPA: sulfotransferase, partial [Bacteroidia bacterium]|nr:sulfotransferase [Bacteroidia bacterium]
MSVNNFQYIIIGGSTKCATTSVFAYLANHPSIASSKVKESRFFWMDEYPLKNGAYNIVDGIESYEQVFLEKTGANIRLEATPDYLYSRDTALAIKENLEDVKLIFIVRNPIERIISWYKFAKQLNLILATETIEAYINQQLNYVGNDAPQHLRSVEQGLYGKYLKHYFEIFGKDKICVLDYEQISSNPLKAMKSIADFLKIDAAFYESYSFEVLNKSVQVKDA